MKKYKYEIEVTSNFRGSYSFPSNSRNARRHLYENNAWRVIVYKSNTSEMVSMASMTCEGFVIAGAIKQK